MTELCKSCSGWNDYKGKCNASFWCPDKEAVNGWDVEDEDLETENLFSEKSR